MWLLASSVLGLRRCDRNEGRLGKAIGKAVAATTPEEEEEEEEEEGYRITGVRGENLRGMPYAVVGKRQSLVAVVDEGGPLR
jgi:hypothetical protein